jgi:molecular chaperone GrpE
LTEEKNPNGEVREDEEAETEQQKEAPKPHKDAHHGKAEEWKRKYEELFDQHVRLKAEYANYMKRTEKEKAAVYEFAKCETVGAFLPVLDNFERAMKSEAAHKSHSAFKEGIEKVYRQMTDVLDKQDVECIAAVGEKFDPELHNAVMHEEDDTKGEGEITEELQKGYKHKERVIRHSMVKVAN